MFAERATDRITIAGKVHCRSADGEDCIVLRWRRQVDEAAPDAPARWVDAGTAVFTLFDSSAVIQISGSALQVVGTGTVLHVIDDVEEDAVAPVPMPVRAAVPARESARSGAVTP